MSDLKHQSLDELKKRKASSEKHIHNLKKSRGKLLGQINNEETRLTWINTYITEKTPIKAGVNTMRFTISELITYLSESYSLDEDVVVDLTTMNDVLNHLDNDNCAEHLADVSEAGDLIMGRLAESSEQGEGISISKLELLAEKVCKELF